MWGRGDPPENIPGSGESHAEYFIILAVGTLFSPYGVSTRRQVFTISNFIFDFSQRYWSNQDLKQKRITPPVTCRDLSAHKQSALRVTSGQMSSYLFLWPRLTERFYCWGKKKSHVAVCKQWIILWLNCHRHSRRMLIVFKCSCYTGARRRVGVVFSPSVTLNEKQSKWVHNVFSCIKRKHDYSSILHSVIHC